MLNENVVINDYLTLLSSLLCKFLKSMFFTLWMSMQNY